MPTDFALLDRIERHVCDVAARSRDTVAVGPFDAFFSEGSDDYLLSLAVPRATPVDWAPALRALDEAFAARDRRTRLEFFGERYPTLGSALLAAGYCHDGHAPVMVLVPDEFAPQPAVPGVRFVRITAMGDEVLDAFLAMQSSAYSMAMANPAWRAMIQAGLRDGWMTAAALERGGVLVSGASLIIGAGVAELAGVGTLPAQRRRGLAADVCTRLLATYFDGGHDLCWLSAAERAEGTYRRLGFRGIGTQHNYGRPARVATG